MLFFLITKCQQFDYLEWRVEVVLLFLRSVNDLSAPDDEESAVADVGRVDLAVVVRQHHKAGGRRTDNGLLAFLKKKFRVKLKLGFEKDNWKHLLRQQPKT
jgi:hypothetical protein